MRKVIVVSSALNRAKSIETSSTTWGQLRQEAQLADFLNSNVEAVVSPDNVTLNRDEAVLPTGDFKLFLVPTKNKAGVGRVEAQSLGHEIAEAIYQASQLSGENQVSELKEALISSIEEFFNVDLYNGTDPELQEALREAQRFA